MKLTKMALLLAFAATSASAQQYVQGYTRADGTYVQGYYRSAPNGTRMDNYSTQGNVNPYTGQVGTRNPYANTVPQNQSPYQMQAPQQPVYTPLYTPTYTQPYQPQPVPQSRFQSSYPQSDNCCR